jgi:phosphoglycolate phosphatase
MVDSVIFDLDGTLWSCVDTCIEAWNQVLVAKGIDVVTKQQLQSVMGLQHDKLAEKLFPFLMDSEKLEVIEEIYKIEVALIRKRGGKLFKNEAFLDYYKVNALITDYESSGNTGRGKAYNIKLVIAEYDLRNTVYIGDTIGDLEACKEVGIPFIYADYGFGSNLEVLYQISDIGDLINFYPQSNF